MRAVVDAAGGSSAKRVVSTGAEALVVVENIRHDKASSRSEV